jgi:hypothetical protein
MKKPVMNPAWDQFNPHDHSREEYDAAMKQYNEYLEIRAYLESLGIDTDEEEKEGLLIMKMIHEKAAKASKEQL